MQSTVFESQPTANLCLHHPLFLRYGCRCWLGRHDQAQIGWKWDRFEPIINNLLSEFLRFW
jgi:hypothetical protein